MYGVGGEYLLDVKVDGITYPVGEGRLAHIRVHEWSNHLAPVAELALDDRDNFLVEMKGLTGTEVFDIGIGDTEDNIVYHSYRLFRTVATRHGADSHLVKLFLISAAAAPIFTPARYKSYAGNRISDVVKAIAADLGLGADVETTDGTFDLFCPGWTYAQFLTRLADSARSVAHGTTGFLCFVDLDDKLNFYSAEYANVRREQINVVRKDLADPDRYAETDVDLGPYRVYQNIMLMGGQGAWGATAAYFDFEAGKFVEAPLTVDGSQGAAAPTGSPGFAAFEAKPTARTTMKGLADNLSVLSNQTDGYNVVVNAGVVSDASNRLLTEARAESRLLRALLAMNKQELMIVGDLRVRAGGVIGQQVGSPIKENVVNQTFSGRWLVERVTHQLVPEYITKVMVTRAGMSGSDKAGLLVPPGGVV